MKIGEKKLVLKYHTLPYQKSTMLYHTKVPYFKSKNFQID